jgi:hypothetical protein
VFTGQVFARIAWNLMNEFLMEGARWMKRVASIMMLMPVSYTHLTLPTKA